MNNTKIWKNIITFIYKNGKGSTKGRATEQQRWGLTYDDDKKSPYHERGCDYRMNKIMGKYIV